jgi:hypothetical protein
MTRLVCLAALAACGTSSPPCIPATNAGCPAELQCETVAGSGDPLCVPPTFVVGTVFQSAPGRPAVSGARVMLLDDHGVPASAATASRFDGTFEIRVHAPRGADLRPLVAPRALRVEASGYQVYPAAYRPSGILDLSDAQLTVLGDRFGLASFDTEIGLVVDATGGTGGVTGTIELPATAQRVLVVAEPQETDGGGGASLADAAGGYQIFGLLSGSYTVRAVALGQAWQPHDVTLNVGERAAVDLTRAVGAGARVSGQVTFAGGPTTASLVVAETFRPEAPVAEIIAGTTQPLASSGTYAVAGVPPGRYVVLAGFGNDGLVRAFASIEVAASDVTPPAPLVLAAPLSLTGPGAVGPEAVTAAPTIAWQAHAGAARYDVDVTDGRGVLVWQRQLTATSVVYAGPLSAGGFYLVRVTARDAGGAVLAITEELRGVFFVSLGLG